MRFDSKVVDCLVDLWVFELMLAPCELSRLVKHCSEDEVERANRFKFKKDRMRHLVCRGRVREILARYTGLSPAQLRFPTTKWGKPYLAGFHGRLFFNVSHSGDLAVIGVSYDYEIGVDLEIPRAVEPKLPETFFSSAEVAALEAMPDNCWLDGFYRCWTRKEAFVKALGTGLGCPLDSFTVSLDDTANARPLIAAEGKPAVSQTWRLLPFRVADRAIGAVCIASGKRPVTLRWLSL